MGAAHCAPAPAASTAGRRASACSEAAGAGASRMRLRGLTSSALSVVQLRMTCMLTSKDLPRCQTGSERCTFKPRTSIVTSAEVMQLE